MKETVKEKKWIEIILALVWIGLIIPHRNSQFSLRGGGRKIENPI
jgi:hypothetical protein